MGDENLDFKEFECSAAYGIVEAYEHVIAGKEAVIANEVHVYETIEVVHLKDKAKCHIQVTTDQNLPLDFSLAVKINKELSEYWNGVKLLQPKK